MVITGQLQKFLKVQNLKNYGFVHQQRWMKHLKAEGHYKIKDLVRLELPGCSLCMGNQARVDEGSDFLLVQEI